jgi:hypothetical protein
MCAGVGHQACQRAAGRLSHVCKRHSVDTHPPDAHRVSDAQAAAATSAAAHGLLCSNHLARAASPAALPFPALICHCCSPEYSTWAGMIVTHYGRLGPTDDGPSDSPYAQFSPTRGMHQLRGYYSTGPSRTQSPQFGGPGAGAWRMCAAALRMYSSAQQLHVHRLPAGMPASSPAVGVLVGKT